MREFVFWLCRIVRIYVAGDMRFFEVWNGGSKRAYSPPELVISIDIADYPMRRWDKILEFVVAERHIQEVRVSGTFHEFYPSLLTPISFADDRSELKAEGEFWKYPFTFGVIA